MLVDFETGPEPDVLAFHQRADADPIINAGRVISIEDIREVYPDYASNEAVHATMEAGRKALRRSCRRVLGKSFCQ